MIDNLRATTDRNQEQDWLKTNLAKFTRMLQGQRDSSVRLFMKKQEKRNEINTVGNRYQCDHTL